MMIRSSVLFCCLLATACSSLPKGATANLDEPGVEDAAAMMSGWFDSADQAESDPDNFFHIRLVMTPVWVDRTDGTWLYVEQAAIGAFERPYRQRIYHVHAPAGAIQSDVYTLPGEASAFAGAYRDPTRFDGLTPDDLTIRSGCAIHLSFDPAADLGRGAFVGSTFEDGCGSTLRGATYATSEVVITASELVSWDRGWDAAGEQVWGATAGGYVFRKRGEGLPSEEDGR